jgi:uncharacterized protein (DUF433 family)
VTIERISIDHRVMGGVPCIRGTRIPVATVVRMLADGITVPEITADYPQLTVDDIRDAGRDGQPAAAGSGLSTVDGVGRG